MTVIYTETGCKPGVTEASPVHMGLQCLHGGLDYAWPWFLHSEEMAFCFANPGVTSVGLNSIYFDRFFSFIFKQENKTEGIFFSTTIMEQMRTGFVAVASNICSTVLC